MSSVTAMTSVTITATYAGASKTAGLSVSPAASPPPPSPLPAPTLLAPPYDARFSPGSAITFDWNDVSGSASYLLEINDSESFSFPLVMSQTTTASTFTTSSLPTVRMWLRLRADQLGRHARGVVAGAAVRGEILGDWRPAHARALAQPVVSELDGRPSRWRGLPARSTRRRI